MNTTAEQRARGGIAREKYDETFLLGLLKGMVQIRRFEEKAGQIVASLGEEVDEGEGLEIFPYFRNQQTL